MSEMSSAQPPDSSESDVPVYSAEFLDFSDKINAEVEELLKKEMERPHQEGEMLNQPVVKVDLFVKEISDKVLAGEDIKELGLKEVLEIFLLAYKINQKSRAGYLWNCMIAMEVPATDLEIITEKMADAEEEHKTLTVSEILDTLKSTRS